MQVSLRMFGFVHHCGKVVRVEVGGGHSQARSAVDDFGACCNESRPLAEKANIFYNCRKM